MRCTKNSDVIQCAIHNALGVGKQNVTSKAELSRATGHKGRHIREAIKTMRYNKAAINLDNGNGYYISGLTLQGRCETVAWITRQDRRVQSMGVTTKDVRRFVNGVRSKGIPGQISMFGMGGTQVGKAQREEEERGERELANLLKDHGYNCRRNRQYCGTNGGADVVGLSSIHIGCRRVERLNLEDTMRQVIDDTEAEKLPFSEEIYSAVFHRRNRGSQLVTMRPDD